MRHMLWFLLAGTRGGETRSHILNALQQTPENAHQLAKRLDLDYKTIQHHLRMLEKHKIVHVVNKGGYGALYFLSPETEAFAKAEGRIWEQFGKKPLKENKSKGA